jgi:hypothetical protein
MLICEIANTISFAVPQIKSLISQLLTHHVKDRQASWRTIQGDSSAVLQNEIWEYVRGDRAHWKQTFIAKFVIILIGNIPKNVQLECSNTLTPSTNSAERRVF